MHNTPPIHDMKSVIRTLTGLTLTALLAGFTGSASADPANNSCWTPGGGNGQGNNRLQFFLNYMAPFGAVEVGEVMGMASVSTSITCLNSYYPGGNFAVQLEMYGRPSGAQLDICDTGLDGVGVRFFASGNPMNCNNWKDEIVNIKVPGGSSTHPINTPNMAEFIKTKATTSLSPGYHEIQVPLNTMYSYWPGHAGSTVWGQYSFTGETRVLVSSCTFSDTAKQVDFKQVSLSDQSELARESFDVNLGNCGSQAEAENFNNLVDIRFDSPLIQPNGALRNASCSDCATGVEIEMYSANGNRIPLTQKYDMATGDFTINAPNIVHRFEARLVKSGTTTTGGKIDSSVTMVLTTI